MAEGIELITAAATGLVAMAEMVLAEGVDIHVDNDMPLRTAALMGNTDMVRFLVDKGANVQASGNEALLYAAKRQDDATVAFLLSKGANINDMLRTHKKEIDQDCLDILDRHQSQKLRDAFEKNFAKLKKPPNHLKLPKRPKP
jgi:ankyrin repeat protein